MVFGSLKARVSNFINCGIMFIPNIFRNSFLIVASQIDQDDIYNKGDSLIWTPSLTG